MKTRMAGWNAARLKLPLRNAYESPSRLVGLQRAALRLVGGSTSTPIRRTDRHDPGCAAGLFQSLTHSSTRGSATQRIRRAGTAAATKYPASDGYGSSAQCEAISSRGR